MFFFLFWKSDNLDLHYFPTRRSSDLERLSAVATNEKDSSFTFPGGSGTQTPKPKSRTRASKPQTDRKSTRLNSSHVSISYAVFCLKKKKIYEDFIMSHKPRIIKSLEL